MNEPEEYIDVQTGIRLTVETEYPYDPDWPRITAYVPEGRTIEIEEGKAAIRRLLRRTAYGEDLENWVRRKP